MSEPGRLTELPWPVLDERVQSVLRAMAEDGSWGRYHGPHCAALTEALSQYHQADHVILCSSGTAAIELALRGIGVTAGDEVILSAYDFKANFVNVLTLGATPVLIDTLPGVPVMDYQQLPSAITQRTRAIICSHLHGSLAPMRHIAEIGAAHRIPVVEDACQSPGARIDGAVAGTWGTVGTLSFGGSKLLTSGRGGAIVTRDSLVAQRIRLYVQRGNDAYPLSEMQAAVLLPQLQQLDDRNQRRLNQVGCLQSLLTEDPVRDQPFLACFAPDDNQNPQIAAVGGGRVAGDLPVFYKLGICCPDAGDRSVTESRSEAARAAGIPLDPGFPALHRIHGKRRFRAADSLHNADGLHDRLMVLHHPVLLCGDAEIRQVHQQLRQIPGLQQP